MEFQLLYIKRVIACHLPEGGKPLTPDTLIRKFYFILFYFILFYFILFYFFVFLPFLGPILRHMEVPRPGLNRSCSNWPTPEPQERLQPTPQLTATPDP